MNRTTRTLLVLAVALVAAFAASYAAYLAIQRMPPRKVETAEVQTVVAARRIVLGGMLATADVKLVPWPAKSPVPGSFTSIDKVVNRGAVVTIAENEPITEDKLAPLNSGAGLPPTIKAGMRAISVKVNEVIGVAGFVVPGTRVDVIVAVDEQGQSRDPMARVVVSNVEVLSAGTKIDQDKARKDGQPIPAAVVTLMVTPDDAEKITLALNKGRIMLTLRNPLDVEPSKTNGVRLASLLGPAAPPPVEKTVKGRKVMVKAAPPPPVPAAAPKAYTVETIKAAKKTDEIIKAKKTDEIIK